MFTASRVKSMKVGEPAAIVLSQYSASVTKACTVEACSQDAETNQHKGTKAASGRSQLVTQPQAGKRVMTLGALCNRVIVCVCRYLLPRTHPQLTQCRQLMQKRTACIASLVKHVPDNIGTRADNTEGPGCGHPQMVHSFTADKLSDGRPHDCSAIGHT